MNNNDISFCLEENSQNCYASMRILKSIEKNNY